VLYWEDTGAWCYDPAAGTMIESGERSAAWLGRQIEQFLPALAGRWFFRDATGATFGVAASQAHEFCQTADLFLNVSGATMFRRADFPRAYAAYLDSDPLYSQIYAAKAVAGMLDEEDRYRLDVMKSYDSTLTLGENVGRPDCLVPAELFDWRPTRPPTLVDAMRENRVPIDARRRVLSTVGAWQAYKKPITVRGQQYFGKSPELIRFKE